MFITECGRIRQVADDYCRCLRRRPLLFRGPPAQPGALLSRPIPSSGEALPVIGLGSWITFNVGTIAPHAITAQKSCAIFSAAGAGVDSSPMYGCHRKSSVMDSAS